MPQTQAWLISPSLSAASRPVCFHFPLTSQDFWNVLLFITTRWQQSVTWWFKKCTLGLFCFPPLSSFYTMLPRIPEWNITKTLLTLNSYCHNLQLTVWLFFCSASRFYWSDESKRCTRQPTSGKEEERKEEECRGHGSAFHEQEQSPCSRTGKHPIKILTFYLCCLFHCINVCCVC